MIKRLTTLGVSLLLLHWTMPVSAQSENCTEIGQVASAQGSVRVQAADGSEWSALDRNSVICEGDTIQTGFRSRAAVNLANETVIRVAQGSTTRLDNFSAGNDAQSVMRLLTGVIHFFSRKPEEYAISTSTATIGIRGTEFVVIAGEDRTEVTVFEGVVQAQNDVEPITLGGGETVSIVNGQTLRSTTPVQPREQVQWGLYYPPVLALGGAGSAALAAADACARSGDFECAFREAEKITEDGRDALYYTLFASLQLAVGDTEAAARSLDNALEIDDENANALALGAIVALTQNRDDDALRAAQRAVDADPQSATAAIALSYVQQSRLELETARDTLQGAVTANPDNPLAHARLAELQLALGDLDASRESAARAVELEPALARTHMVSGYTALSRIDTGAAIEAFETALQLDSADPMAHLGLGLALIRDGELEDGRREFEIAVALDSNSAILRPYLGRAYYEEKRSPLDAEQYAMAKQLDPNDPTAYLFDALRLHSENRPVEAADELRASIERNDNRAVYRGRNLLDQDRAARGASLARIHGTLGFTQQGINEASGSLSVDPASDSAHRFLSDTYLGVRRREIARVSELLQAQMLQDINMNPVQPSVSAVNLNLGTGSGDVGLNEFSKLFERNGVQPAVSLLGGSNDTTGAEAVLSGVHDSLSFSIGAYDYESDGWRENNGQDQQLGNLFLQWAATPKLNLQFEISSRESTEGDLAFNFDPDSFDPTLDNEKDFDSSRIGLRYSPTPDSDILFSYIESERNEQQVAQLIGVPAITGFTLIDPGPPPIIVPNIEFVDYDSDIERTDDSKQAEIQYLLKQQSFNLVAGLTGAQIDTETDTLLTAPPEVLVPIIPELDQTVSNDLEHLRVYAYTTLQAGSDIDLTVGLSADEYDDSGLTETIRTTNPKLGLVWRVNPRQTLRFTALEVTKPSLANNRTLEPTQVAGFNQFYDDVNATDTRLVGIGYDVALTSRLSAGIEAISRELEIPFLFTDINAGNAQSTGFEEQEEDNSRIYLYWTPTNSLAITASLVADRFESGTDGDVNTPITADTDSLPLSITYFSPSRWYAGVTATRVDQEIERNALSALAGGEDEFTVIDLNVGYRLPRRFGSVSLQIQNAADEEFMYQDDSYREFRDEPSTGPYFPERTAFVRLNLVF